MSRKDHVDRWIAEHHDATVPDGFAESVMRRAGRTPRGRGRRGFGVIRRLVAEVPAVRVGVCGLVALLAATRVLAWFVIFLPG